MISARVRSGYVAANRAHIALPSVLPNSAACSDPTALITACTSSMRCSSVGVLEIRSDSPVPRLSKRISRENDANLRRNRA